MKFNNFKNIHSEYRVLYGEKGKKYYALSKKFWDFIQNQLERGRFKTKRDLARFINQITNKEITLRAIDSWFYHGRKPIIAESFETNKSNNKDCSHGFSYFCPLCNLNKKQIEECPVSLFWITHPQGKTYVYENYWKELKNYIDNSYKYGLLLSNLYPKINIESRVIRKWKINKDLPRLFNADEFSFSCHNLYLLGIFLSDGHIRNNGSELSFTYQVGSSDIFQGYWYPQFIQRVLPIFKHKKILSNTYFTIDKTHHTPIFRTNISSISPIFIKKLIEQGVIEKRKISATTGWKKSIPEAFLKTMASYEEYFQGVFDGDGSYGFYTSPAIHIATAPEIDYSYFIDCLPLVPTTTSQDKKKTILYSNRNTNCLYSVRLAPDSLRNLPKEYNAADIVKQLDFFINSAQNSIRPDKVHKLIKIIKTITSKNYGEYRNCLPIQKEIRDIAVKAGLADKIEPLEKRYSIKNNRYQPFMPKWAEGLCSKNETWDFFFNKENLVFKVEDKLKDIDFSEGVPLDFKL